MNFTADAAARTRALTDISSTLLVEAAAGTGKTALIAGRVTVLLSRGIDPSNIAAITFTEFAASELSARVHGYVADLLEGTVPAPLALAFPRGLSESERRFLSAASDKLDQLSAATIHSFCRELISSYAVESNIDPGAQIIDGDQSDAVFRSIVDRWLKRRLNHGDRTDPVAVLSRAEPRKVVELLRKLATFRLKHRRANTLPADLAGRPDLELKEAVTTFSQWLSKQPAEDQTRKLFEDLERLAVFYEDSFATPLDFERLWRLAHPPTLAAMRKGTSELLKPKLRSAWDRAAGKGAGAQLHEEMLQHFELVDRCYRVILGKLSTAIVAALGSRLQEILQEYAEFKRAAAVLDFDDLTETALHLVAHNEAVRVAIGERYKCILVDEFQDTDAAQCQILFSIAGETMANAWAETRLKPGALFLVGDPKQAIYRFRGASVETYLKARTAIANSAPQNVLRLTANFRSRPAILSYVNQCFEAPLSRTDQPGYVPLSATLSAPDRMLPCVARLEVQVPPTASVQDIRQAEASAVAELCKRLVSTFEYQNINNTTIQLHPKDIALLTPASSSLSIYESAFEEYGLPFASQTGKNLYRRQEVQDALALIRTLADPLDTAAFGALMRGPLVGLHDQTLLDISTALKTTDTDAAAHFTVLTDPARVNHVLARSVLETLQRLRRRSHSTTPALLIAEAVEQLMVLPILAAREGKRWAQAVANLEALIQRAKHYDVKGLRAFTRDLDEAWATKAQESEGRADAEDVVSVITMHSAKGLEWPVVIPINTVTQFRPRDSYVHRESDNTVHWVIGDVVSPDLADALWRDGQHTARERERLLYVACTRARELLVVPDFGRRDGNTWVSAVDFMLGAVPTITVPPTIQPYRPAEIAESNDQTADAFAVEKDVIRRASTPLKWHRATDTDADRQASVELATPEGDVTEVVLPVGAGRVRGLVLHKLMEEILTGEISEMLSELTSRSESLLKQLIVEGDRAAALPAAEELAATIIRTLGLPEIAVLRPTLVAELPVYAITSASSDSRAALTGRIDAVSVVEGKVPLPIDWKSDVAPTDADINAHSAQLEDYMRALGCPRGMLVYMTTGRVHWVSVRAS